MPHISGDEVLGNIKQANLYYQQILLRLLQSKPEDFTPPFLNNKEAPSIVSKLLNYSLQHPDKFNQVNIDHLGKLHKLINNTVHKFTNQEYSSEETDEIRDRRFKDPAWKNNIYFDFIRQYYALSSHWLQNNIDQYDVDNEVKRYLEFITSQFMNAMSPSNFIFSNPEVIRESLNSSLKNIVKGMENFLHDFEKSHGLFNITTTDENQFELGKNIATTEGKVIYQNDLMQLICYKPENNSHAVPIFIIPPWINKYYILDLSKNNSLVRWLVKNNFQVFLVSWVNPDKKLANKNFEDYIERGIIQPYKQIQQLGFNKVNAVGYCIGGTLLAAALSVLQNKQLNYINNATFLTTLIDFTDPGEIGAFINKATLDLIEQEVKKKGYLDGKYISHSFSLIRVNDLVWSFFVNNYLLGKQPNAFDILYWNSDATNLPQKMYLYYLKNMYIDNLLKVPGKLTMLGSKVDLSKITLPIFSLAAKGDHIALWKSVYDGMKLFSSTDKTFCLTEAGHVAGIINPAGQQKYSHNIGFDFTGDAESWLKGSKAHHNSWWNCWLKWLQEKSGKLQKSINYNDLSYIEKAPGSYVKMKSE